MAYVNKSVPFVDLSFSLLVTGALETINEYKSNAKRKGPPGSTENHHLFGVSLAGQ